MLLVLGLALAIEALVALIRRYETTAVAALVVLAGVVLTALAWRTVPR